MSLAQRPSARTLPHGYWRSTASTSSPRSRARCAVARSRTRSSTLGSPARRGENPWGGSNERRPVDPSALPPLCDVFLTGFQDHRLVEDEVAETDLSVLHLAQCRVADVGDQPRGPPCAPGAVSAPAPEPSVSLAPQPPLPVPSYRSFIPLGRGGPRIRIRADQLQHGVGLGADLLLDAEDSAPELSRLRAAPGPL